MKIRRFIRKRRRRERRRLEDLMAAKSINAADRETVRRFGNSLRGFVRNINPDGTFGPMRFDQFYFDLERASR